MSYIHICGRGTKDECNTKRSFDDGAADLSHSFFSNLNLVCYEVHIRRPQWKQAICALHCFEHCGGMRICNHMCCFAYDLEGE